MMEEEEEEEEVMRLVGFFGDLAIPADLALRILLAVPLGRQLFRLRCVCCHWNNLLRSRSFLRAWSQRHTNSCCFVMLPPFPSYPPADVDCEWRLASQDSNRLRTHLTAFLVEAPHISNTGYWFELPLQWFDRGQSPGFELMQGELWFRALGGGSRAGLVVDMIYNSYMGRPPLIRVHDVLAGTYRYLPSPSSSNLVPSSFCLGHPIFGSLRADWANPNRDRRPGLLLLSSEDGRNYHVVIHSEKKASLLIYDSRRPHTWRAVACIPKPELEEPSTYRHGLFENKDIYKGDLYFPVVQMNTLFAYCIESDEWINIEVQFPTPCRWDAYPTIVKYEGTRILMAMARFTEERVTLPMNIKRTLYGFDVWELEQNDRFGSYNWVEVARAPQTFTEVHYDTLCTNFSPRITCSSTLICMTSSIQSKELEKMGTWGRCMPPLVYNVVTDSWFYMPPYKGARDFVGLFSFQATSSGLLL